MTRREWLHSALLSAPIMLLLSCGGDDADEEAPQREPSSRAGTSVAPVEEAQTLTLAILDTPLAVNPAQKVIQDWNSGNIPGAPPGALLQHVKIPLQGGVRDSLAAQEAGGVAVDLIWLPYREDIPDLFKAGALAPLDRWLEADQARPLEAFTEEARHLVRFRAQTLALPVAIAPGVLAHNSLRFRSADLATPTPDWTWVDFIEAARRLTEDTNGDGAVDRWGFVAAAYFPDWLPFLLQEGGMVANLDSGEVGLDGKESLRALNAWDELGRVHGILPHGPNTSVRSLVGYNDLFQRGMFFSCFFQYLPEHWRLVTPLPRGASNSTPLVLAEALAIPAAAQGERSYEALVPLAHWMGERRALPSTTAGWQFVKKPDRDHFDLVFPEPTRDTVLDALSAAKASHVASSQTMSQTLFNIITYPLARGEVGIEQAIERAANWLQSYVDD